jgi:ribosomal-protein-alanine N-acetyltransferase
LLEPIRRATANDAAAVSIIDKGVNPSPWAISRIQALCGMVVAETAQTGHETKQHILVAEVAGKVCGFIAISCLLQEGEIQNLGVSSARQGEGIGKALVQAALDLLCDCSALRCLLEVRHSNDKARNLYEKCGFSIDGIRKNYYQSGQGREDAILMSLNLQGEPRERT